MLSISMWMGQNGVPYIAKGVMGERYQKHISKCVGGHISTINPWEMNHFMTFTILFMYL